MYTFEEQYKEYLEIFNAYLEKYCDNLDTNPEILGVSMQYSLLNGGKRIRPILALAVADVLGIQRSEILPFTLALEMIHTYSLIHDDLPGMDNDDFRRGKPSSHKKFGEGNAILAGDALLNTAYAICFDECFKGDEHIQAAKYLSECAGINGMILGQSMDLYLTAKNEEVSEEELFTMYKNKTGKLLLAPLVIPCILDNSKYYLEFEKFGNYLGLLFQITDDILDVSGTFKELGKSIGKDKAENKYTSVNLYSLSGAEVHADLYAEKCYAVLDGIDGNTNFLRDLVTFIRDRRN